MIYGAKPVKSLAVCARRRILNLNLRIAGADEIARQHGPVGRLQIITRQQVMPQDAAGSKADGGHGIGGQAHARQAWRGDDCEVVEIDVLQ